AVDHLLWDPEWGRGFGGYGYQYASGFGRRLISNTVEFGAILMLRQDTRYRPSRQKGLFRRVRDAATHAFRAPGPNGEFQPSYARFAGITGGALITPAWHKHGLSAHCFGRNMAFSATDQVQNSLLTEFSPDLLKIGRQVRRKVLGK